MRASLKAIRKQRRAGRRDHGQRGDEASRKETQSTEGRRAGVFARESVIGSHPMRRRGRDQLDIMNHRLYSRALYGVTRRLSGFDLYWSARVGHGSNMRGGNEDDEKHSRIFEGVEAGLGIGGS